MKNFVITYMVIGATITTALILGNMVTIGPVATLAKLLGGI